MSNIIDKARQIQNKIENNRKNKKDIREQRYRKFLLDPPRHLPSLCSLVRWRNITIAVVFCIIAVPSMQILLFYNTLFEGWTEVISITCFVTAMILAGFAGTLDWAIYRRFGNEKSLIQW